MRSLHGEDSSHRHRSPTPVTPEVIRNFRNFTADPEVLKSPGLQRDSFHERNAPVQYMHPKDANWREVYYEDGGK